MYRTVVDRYTALLISKATSTSTSHQRLHNLSLLYIDASQILLPALLPKAKAMPDDSFTNDNCWFLVQVAVFLLRLNQMIRLPTTIEPRCIDDIDKFHHIWPDEFG